MPGVLIVEAMAQTAGALVVHSLGLAREKHIVYFMTIEKARFRKPVHAGRHAAHAGQGAAAAAARSGASKARPMSAIRCAPRRNSAP